MTDAYALLADATALPQRRTPLLRSADDGFTVRGWVMPSADRQLLLIRAWLNYEKYTYVVIDERASIVATATGETHEIAYQRVREELERKGIPLGERREEYSLLADHIDGNRRTSVVGSDDGMWTMRVKLIQDDDNDYIQLRVGANGLGYVHVVLDQDGAVVAFVTGATDSDAWGRLQGELRRRGVDID